MKKTMLFTWDNNGISLKEDNKKIISTSEIQIEAMARKILDNLNKEIQDNVIYRYKSIKIEIDIP